MSWPIPLNETVRLDALRALEILDTGPDPQFDALIRVTQRTFGVPIAVISLVDRERQWFKARCGLEFDATPREVAFSAHAIMSDEVLVIEDAAQDPRFRDNPFVTGKPNVRFYAGAPLILDPGVRVGTLSITDTIPRSFAPEQSQSLRDLAEIVVAQLRLHAANARSRNEVIQRQARDAQIAEQACMLLEREAVIADQTHSLHQREVKLNEANRLLSMAEELARVGHWRVNIAT